MYNYMHHLVILQRALVYAAVAAVATANKQEAAASGSAAFRTDPRIGVAAEGREGRLGLEGHATVTVWCDVT